MFQGLIAASLGHTGRFVLPNGWRGYFADGQAVVSRSNDDCWRVYPAAAWDAWAANFTGKVPKQRCAKRPFVHVIGNSRVAAVDKQGRIAIPARLRATMNIPVLPCAAVLAGRENFFEVWCRENWERGYSPAPERGQ